MIKGQRSYKHPLFNPRRLLAFVGALGGIPEAAKKLGVDARTLSKWLDGSIPSLEHQRDVALYHAKTAPLTQVEQLLEILQDEAKRAAQHWEDVQCDQLPLAESQPVKARFHLATTFYRTYGQVAGARL